MLLSSICCLRSRKSLREVTLAGLIYPTTPMSFLLSQRVINGKYSHWIMILQEFDLEFVTPKSNKSLPLCYFISNWCIRPAFE
jgi:hypothetical protein